MPQGKKNRRNRRLFIAVHVVTSSNSRAVCSQWRSGGFADIFSKQLKRIAAVDLVNTVSHSSYIRLALRPSVAAPLSLNRLGDNAASTEKEHLRLGPIGSQAYRSSPPYNCPLPQRGQPQSHMPRQYSKSLIPSGEGDSGRLPQGADSR